MKFFYKKDFQRVTEEYKKLEDAYKVLARCYSKLERKYKTNLSELENISLELNKHIKIVQKMENSINVLKKEKKQINGSKGGLTKEVNKLKNEVQELETKLKESMTGKYLVKKIPSGKTPKGQVAKIGNHQKQSNAIKLVKEGI